MLSIIKATVSASNACVAIVVARFNSFINEKLLEGAIDILKRVGQIEEKNLTIIWVPGSYEIPIIVNVLTKSRKYDAIIALGTIIRGDTIHFKCISDAVSNGLAHIARDTEIPVAFGLLTTDNIEQAIERAGTKMGNKGAEAALTALEMINILRNIKVSLQNR